MRWTSATEMEWNVIKPNARQKSYKIGCFRTDEVQSLLEIAVHENWSNTIFLVLSSQDYFGWFHPNNPNVTQSQSLDTLLLLLLLALVFSWTKFFLSGPYLIYFFLHHIKLQLFCVFLLLVPFAALSYAEWFDVLLPFFSILFFLVPEITYWNDTEWERAWDVRDEIHVRTIVLTFIIQAFFYLFVKHYSSVHQFKKKIVSFLSTLSLSAEKKFERLRANVCLEHHFRHKFRWLHTKLTVFEKSLFHISRIKLM